MARRVDLVLKLSLHQCSLASGCMWIWFADSILSLVGFLYALQFPPTLKIRILSYSWSIVADLSLCVKACLSAWGLITYVCTTEFTQCASRTHWVDMSHVKKNCNLLLLLLLFTIFSHECSQDLFLYLHFIITKKGVIHVSNWEMWPNIFFLIVPFLLHLILTGQPKRMLRSCTSQK